MGVLEELERLFGAEAVAELAPPDSPEVESPEAPRELTEEEALQRFFASRGGHCG